ncbi:MAG: hypothetical protein ABIL25_08390 [candidate division WOR-3 bacterium]
MKTSEVLAGLEQECRGLGVKLYYDDLQSEGGLCRLRDSYYLIINRRTSAETKIRIIRHALAEIRRNAAESSPGLTTEAARPEPTQVPGLGQ